MGDPDDSLVTITYHPRLVAYLMSTPLRRRMVFLSIVAVIAVLVYVEFRISFELYAQAACMPKPSCVDSKHLHDWYAVAAWTFRAACITGMTGIALRFADRMQVVDDYMKRARAKNRNAPCMPVDDYVRRTRRVLSVLTYTGFIASIGALIVLSQITQHLH